MKKIAINGFGRIGRMAFSSIIKKQLELDVVAINDLAHPSVLAHLFEFDSTFGRFEGKISYTDNSLIINDKEILVFSERDPADLPWGDLEIDVVLECTGFFTKKEDAIKHINQGAKRVVISAPAKGDIDGTFVMGVNDNEFDPEKHFVVSNASCTTNCLAPVAKVIDENFGIVKGLMTTIHSYTGDQRLLDAPHKDMRRARSACLSMVPTTTGAAKAVSLVLPQLKGKLNGYAIRIPTPTVSLVDLTVELSKKATPNEINEAIKNASENELSGILGFEPRPLVSIDYKMDSRSSIVDAEFTNIIGGNMAKILTWYDNEWGYSNRLVELARKIA
ncbi:MAG: type I glyceraldehyde-3-phosphate dehydrogenase [Candidatus Gracilibacteria bacterium]|jgi:glyceraldehyde 3-phosphate dehydrogenase|nr:type I glyceraldehyde-3-phosphate dehydrogenase [Candidatus Gracilibacteria bacterium]